MVGLIVLNVILIALVIFLALYILNNKGDSKSVCIDNNDKYFNDTVENKGGKYKQNKKIKCERVFDGRFVSDEEYQQMIKSRRSYISVLLENIDKEYEYLKELNNNEGTEGNNTR